MAARDAELIALRDQVASLKRAAAAQPPPPARASPPSPKKPLGSVVPHPAPLAKPAGPPLPVPGPATALAWTPADGKRAPSAQQSLAAIPARTLMAPRPQQAAALAGPPPPPQPPAQPASYRNVAAPQRPPRAGDALAGDAPPFALSEVATPPAKLVPPVIGDSPGLQDFPHMEMIEGLLDL